MKTSMEIRNQFLDFFASKDHKIVDSAPIVNHGDPTLFFCNAGMNQFKDIFLGTRQTSDKRVANTQKCLRVSGKHNDLDVVGRDTYHHTFFEMLGNWSFGDYFKKDAISWAWEFLTKVLEIPQERLWVTVFGGDEQDGVPADEEASTLWHEVAGVPKERILPFGKGDNFWEMGKSGPCGPCSEIHIDRGETIGDLALATDPKLGVNGENDRFIEIWNLVFIEYNRNEDGGLESLPAKHVDTGMGFERLVAYLQDKKSNYDTDLLAPIIQETENLCSMKYSAQDTLLSDVAFRVIADHIRAITIAFADGGLPGNKGSGFVLRRILRRAALFAKEYLNTSDAFLHKLVPCVGKIYADIFPEILQQQDHIMLVIKSEEESFSKVLENGTSLFNKLLEETKSKNLKEISGTKAYSLYETHGFPVDLIELMAEQNEVTINHKEWKKAEEKHRELSKDKEFDYNFSMTEIEGLPATKFNGYGKLSGQAKLLKLIGTDKIILDRTTFYAESGGQVSDTGTITGKNFAFQVDDTQKHGEIYVHYGQLVEGNLSQLPRWVSTHVDKQRRRKIMANHTATHLLHSALHRVLGEHAVQRGSEVSPERLRFDVSHPQKITQEQVLSIERIVNEAIAQNTRVSRRICSLDEAKSKGAMALFGEKYGEKVRVVSISNYSMELCGGTHVHYTGNIGCFKITSEGAVQAGVRRIEAVTRGIAIENIQEKNILLDKVQTQLKVGEEQVLEKISQMQDEIKELRKTQKQFEQQQVKIQRDALLQQASDINGVKFVFATLPEAKVENLRDMADLMRKSSTPCAGVISCEKNGKLPLVVFVSDHLADHPKLHAGELLKKVCDLLGGGGNAKRKDFAQGQAIKINQINEAQDLARDYITAATE
ncbi:alanine--tRNA ligase [Candidatus Uabimicrobium amorphum]|uniref:Alanine--tRNA ligase n=1 Tax=Uabimicrobium amorphum TaxID=2596890 RepID=A0A5S9ITS7_UABAM|nr:alanine--tRNA ligase [Candidatus Uabimicrobium amorphum]BBM87959.1 alanine--tRNA ligase [Candidatus Uabimicrobium amorphum]